jgi:hypothetical protein
MKPELDLLSAARCFSFTLNGHSDDDIVGTIRGVYVYAGEVRRLNQAIHAMHAAVAKDTADDGPEVAILSCDLNS